MTDDTRSGGDPAGGTGDEPGDPTADFLDEVRAEETPWRRDRPPQDEAAGPVAELYQPQTHFQRAAGAVGRAAPYVALGGMAGWAGAQAYEHYTSDDDQAEVPDVDGMDFGGGA